MYFFLGDRRNSVTKVITIKLLDKNDHAPTLISVNLEVFENLGKVFIVIFKIKTYELDIHPMLCTK